MAKLIAYIATPGANIIAPAKSDFRYRFLFGPDSHFNIFAFISLFGLFAFRPIFIFGAAIHRYIRFMYIIKLAE